MNNFVELNETEMIEVDGGIIGILVGIAGVYVGSCALAYTIGKDEGAVARNKR